MGAKIYITDFDRVRKIFGNPLVIVPGLILPYAAEQIEKDNGVSVTTIRQVIHGRSQNKIALAGLIAYLNEKKQLCSSSESEIYQNIDKVIKGFENRLKERKKKDKQRNKRKK